MGQNVEREVRNMRFIYALCIDSKLFTEWTESNCGKIMLKLTQPLFQSMISLSSVNFQKISRILEGSYLPEFQNEGGSNPSEFWTYVSKVHFLKD